jgi:hypothetical protein
MKFNYMGKMFILMAALALVGVQAASAATIQMRITDYTPGMVQVAQQIIDDNVAPDGFIAVLGKISFTGGVGNWNLQINAGTGDPLLPPATMDLSYNVQAIPGTNDILVIEFSQKGNTEVSPAWNAKINGNWAHGAGDLTFQAFESNTNVWYAQTYQIGSDLTFLSGADQTGSTSGAIPMPPGVISPYSLTMLVKITGDGTSGEQTTGDATLKPVPEPTGILLLGSGLAGLALWLRRKSAQ